MSLAFNGTSSKGSYSGNLATGGYPYAIFAWMKCATVNTEGMVAGFASGQGTYDEVAIYSHGGTGKVRGYHKGPGAVGQPSSTTSQSTAYQPVMVVATSSNTTIYYAGGAKVIDSTVVTINPALPNVFTLGVWSETGNSLYFTGEISEPYVWQGTVPDDADWTALQGGALPESIKASYLKAGWKLETQAASQVGFNGLVLTMTGTTQGGTHPITRGSGPSITGSPSNATAAVGATATFSVTASAAGGGTLSYLWQRSTDAGVTWSPAPAGTGVTTASYTTPAATTTGGTANNGDRYRCMVVEAGGTQQNSGFTSAATLTVGAAGPALSSPTIAGVTATGATPGITTDTATGTLYLVLSTTNTAPSAAQVKAGQNAAGAAVPSNSQAISSSGAKTASITGLSASTTYYPFWVHTNGSSVDSSVAAGTSFTTSATAGPTINTQPSSATVTTPTAATFTVAATTSGGALSYQWQRSTNGGGSWANVTTGTGGTTSSYTTAATSVSGGNANNGDQYRCAVTDSNGTVNTSAATLTVNAAAATLNFQAAGMEFGRRTGLGIGSFALDTASNYRYTVHADGLVLGAALYTSGVVTTDSAGKFPNYSSGSLTSGTTYRIVAVRQADGEAASFRMVAA